MKNSKIIPIIKNDVERSIKNKWFVILNIFMLLVMIGGLNFNNIKNILKENNVNVEVGSDSKQLNVYVEDKDNLAYKKLEENLKQYENITVEKKDSIQEYENENIDSNTILLKVTKDEKTFLKVAIYSKEGIENKYIDTISATITSIKDSMFAENKNLTSEEIEQIKRDDVYERILLGKNVEENDTSSILNMLSNYLIFFILLLCLSKIANTISQEKMSKSIEYVLTSISVKEYLIAKVLGICIIVLLQFVFIIAYALISVMISMLLASSTLLSSTEVTSNNIDFSMVVNGRIIGYFTITLFFMLFTTVLQGLIQSVMSAKTTNIQEAGNATVLMVMLNLVLYVIGIYAISPIKAPSMFIYVASVIPIVSMYLVPAMFIIGQANIIQIIVSIVLVVASIPLALKLIQKPFKNAILDFTPKKKNSINGIEKIIETREYQERMIERKVSAKKGLVIGFAVILVIVLQIVGSLLESIILPVLTRKITFISENSMYLILLAFVFIISLYVPYLLLKLYTPKEDKKAKKDLNEEELEAYKEENKKSIKKCFKYIVMCIPIISVIQFVCSFAIEKLGVTTDIMDSVGLFNTTGRLSSILLFIVIAVLPAIFEELFIRKGIMGILKDKGAILATVVSALIFATIHLNISQFIFAFLVGIVFGIVRTKTNKLYPTMILHFLNNGIAMIEVLLYRHDTFMEIFTYFNIALNAVGFCILIYMLYKKIMELKDKESIKRLKEELDYRKLKLNIVENSYVFADYTFAIATILSVTMFIAMEKLLALI